MFKRNLEIFLKLVEYGNVTKTSKALYVSQPAVSNALAKLEDELGIQLFFRDKRKGLILTEAGKKIYVLGQYMEDTSNRIYQTAFKERNLYEGKLKIASLPSLTSTIISKTLKKYTTLYPNVTIEIKEGTPNEVLRLVEDYSVDFGVSASPFGKFDSTTLVEDRMIAITNTNMDDKNNSVSLNDPPETLIINKPAYETILEKTSMNEIVKSKDILFVQTPETEIQMVLDGNGIGIISEYTSDTLTNRVKKVPVKPSITFDVGIFANNLKDLTPVALEFVNMLKEINI